jgi:hypothetical protein
MTIWTGDHGPSLGQQGHGGTPGAVHLYRCPCMSARRTLTDNRRSGGHGELHQVPFELHQVPLMEPPGHARVIATPGKPPMVVSRLVRNGDHGEDRWLITRTEPGIPGMSAACSRNAGGSRSNALPHRSKLRGFQRSSLAALHPDMHWR